MPKLDSPLELLPVFKPKVWGRRDLTPLYPGHWKTHRGNTVSIHYPKRAGLENAAIGEVWLTDDNAVFTNGALAGMTLVEACRRFGPALCGNDREKDRFPVLAKFLFTEGWLSIQVHPDDSFARKHEGGKRGKCETWYIIEADQHAEMLLGLKQGVRTEDLAAAIDEGNCERLLRRFTPRAGEAVFVPPGTVHALGPGLTLFEAEENSDLTYRLDDFGRTGLDGKPRPLHRDKALAVSRPELPARRNLPRIAFRTPYGLRRLLVACPYFAVEELTLARIGSFQGPLPRVEALAVISGVGRIETAAGWYAYRAGNVWLIPPATPSYRLVPEARSRLLKFYVPDLKKDFRQLPRTRPIAREKLKQVVFA